MVVKFVNLWRNRKDKQSGNTICLLLKSQNSICRFNCNLYKKAASREYLKIQFVYTM